MIRPGHDIAGDWRRYCPRHYMRMRKRDEVRVSVKRAADGGWVEVRTELRAGCPADEVADMLGFDTEDDLLQAIIRESEDGAGYTHAQAIEDARREAYSDPDVAAIRRAHREAFDQRCEAFADALDQAADWEAYAQEVEAEAHAAEAVMLALAALPAEVPTPAARVEAPALPSRRTRKEADRVAHPGLAARIAAAGRGILAAAADAVRAMPERIRPLARAAAAMIRQRAAEVGEGAAIAGGWLAQAVADQCSGFAREVAATMGGSGRHVKRRRRPAAARPKVEQRRRRAA